MESEGSIRLVGINTDHRHDCSASHQFFQIQQTVLTLNDHQQCADVAMFVTSSSCKTLLTVASDIGLTFAIRCGHAINNPEEIVSICSVAKEIHIETPGFPR
ncbi:hypothetical protein QCA50_009739 [Cerrena zonata]|uniref:Uncharacterized protein n=1 Tax=Cerrena zonata TaxID=2478898 RepID=A0AAW0GAN5_9APHY